ncbi:MAG: BON domain-containing protein [Rhodospirillales bacterium]|nr:BON domain-containing protein [Rhodospirillales bacterium]
MSYRAELSALAIVFSLFAAAPAFALDLNPLSAIKGAVEHAVEDRSSADAATDVKIKASIAAKVIDKMSSDVIAITSDVYEQRVMLTGIVETAEQKEKAGELVKTVERVKWLYNELRVVTKVDREKGAVEGFVDDTVIETKIDAQLLDASGVNSRNYRWRSVHGHVFVLGRALSAPELEKAKQVIKGIEGIQSLTTHVQIRPKVD